ncbi:hypothetical protein XALC_0176 [Xanthomonas albilineans GPE PC73]|uniref:Uncharacterized protein n=2 Tax=Xanthomonas albilineans TaxID=29447 RepID=D2U8I3_XANAP|nr:hypothetical protein XALC_0176 [Xanthomonas albilineans GPE PC73]
MPATALKKLDAAYFASTTAQVQQEIWRDAMRYRWLRLQPVDGGPYGLPRIAIPQSPNAGDFVNDDDADESIDTAMLAAMLDAERAQEQAEQKKEAGADETDYTPGELDPTAPGQEVERG